MILIVLSITNDVPRYRAIQLIVRKRGTFSGGSGSALVSNELRASSRQPHTNKSAHGMATEMNRRKTERFDQGDRVGGECLHINAPQFR
jgi:hypothetical protein